MHIKQIIIQGFKSYKEQTVIEPFSPKHNVIVGRNGTGKSNFFAAIRFVLSDAYTQMSREERQALLHEGSGSAVMSAYVEVIFDNSDDRFPTGKEELILRRTIGAKKDEYSLDRKNATKSDVMNLLESAGFSRSNPYYIVPQGRVTTLTNMKDGERLILLKEVAGTQVYEARRSESIKIMSETDSKRSKIDDLLSYIRERLGELEEEMEELRAYQDKDRERRCLEYTIYHREQEKLQQELDQLDSMRDEGTSDMENNRKRFLEGEKVKSQFEDEIKALKQRMELLDVDKKQFEDERRDATRERAKIELEVNSVTEGQSAAQQARNRHESDVNGVQSTIQEREKSLSTLMPEYEKARSQEKSLKSQLEATEGTRQRLYAKQGRSAQFKSKQERDNWLRNEVDELNIALATRKAVTMQTTEEIEGLEKGIQQTNKEISQTRQKIDNRGQDLHSVSGDVQKAKDARDKLMDQRKELWRKQARLDSVMRNTRHELDGAERSLSHMMDQNTSRGLAAVRRIKQQRQLDGAYGTLAELFTVSERFKTAVEVTAGASLFHYVVDNDDTATKLLEVLQKEKAGRVTFMPLNRLKPKPANIPTANDAVELVSRLQYDPQFDNAFKQVFGKTIVCPDLQIAAQYARSHGVNAITPDGDRSDKKGALTGGYHDPRSSRMDAVGQVSKFRDEYESHKNRGHEIRQELEGKDQEITRAVSQLQKAEQRSEQAEASYGPLNQELRGKVQDLQDKQDQLEKKRSTKENVEKTTSDLKEQQEAYENELASDFKKALSKEEEQQLDSLNQSLPSLRKQHMEISGNRAELQAQKSTIEDELRENLRPRLDQLKEQEHETGAGSSSKLKERQKDLKRVGKAADTAEKKLGEVESSIDKANGQLAQLEEKRAARQRDQEDIARAIEKFQRRMEKGLANRSLTRERLDEVNKSIRDLGILPEEAFSKYKKVTSEQASKRLRNVNEALKSYSHVNKKAFEQYNNFTRQRDALTKRRTELDNSQSSIRGLIEVLDQRKDEAIERTFKQVSREFATIFQRLVPAGRGRLVIQRRTDENAGDLDSSESSSDEEDAGREKGRIENYIGVGISVSFNSKHDEQQRIQQLSGGQKSLCALALVFAIQQCDPAPFYLFDEIDANLDAQYRTAVAELLQSISEGEQSGQFICTTFRPEMIQVAEKCYGVTYASNKTSRIECVPRKDALGFVEGQIAGS
ncbi:MAG: Structural maintenance of chromosomes protein 3 [Alyxoria varia]|nr:MAG: Structural maintenance of chromosomes protein 3 [Alyxoria varia]